MISNYYPQYQKRKCNPQSDSKSTKNGDEEDEMYLGGGHALWGATLQKQLLLESHLPPQRLLLKVLPQVCRG